MKTNDLIGLTISEAIALIKQKERNEFFQYYVLAKESKHYNFFENDKRVHYHDQDGKRAYRVIDTESVIYADNKQLEQDAFIINIEIEKGTHDLWGFNGYNATKEHNIYNLYVDHLKRGNKGHKEIISKKEQLIAYKDGDLTKSQRRFTL